MNTYEFTLVLDGITAQTEGYEDLLFEAGFDDSLVSAYGNMLFINVDREADSAREAITSAIEDAQEAGASVRSINEAGYACASDMAGMAGLTRAAISNYVKGRRGADDFPVPVFGVGQSSPLWYWPEVAQWLHDHDKIDPSIAEVAIAASEALELRHAA